MKIKQIIKIMLLVITLVIITNTVSKANQISYNQESPSLKVADIDIGKEDLSGIYEAQGSTYTSVGGKVIGTVQVICYGAAVIILIYKGVQFMIKSPEAKAELKKELISYTIGAVILFAIGTFVKIIGNIALNDLF